MDFRWVNRNLRWPLSVETIFFDLDDTLCDNRSAIVRAREDTIDYILSKFANQDRHTIQDTYDRIFSEQEQHIGELSNEPATFRSGFEFRVDRFNKLLQGLHLPNENMSVELTNVYGNSKIKHLHAFSEVREVLIKLRKSFLLGVITNGFSDLQNEELDELGLLGLFDHVIISQEVEMRKPEERIFLEALRRTSTLPDKFLMVGDKLKDDILTPKKLGMHAGLVLHNKKPEGDLRIGSDFIIQNLNFLPDLVKHP